MMLNYALDPDIFTLDNIWEDSVEILLENLDLQNKYKNKSRFLIKKLRHGVFLVDANGNCVGLF